MRTVCSGSFDDGGREEDKEDVGGWGAAGEMGEVLNCEEGGETKSAKEGPALRASLNFVGCRCRAGDGVGEGQMRWQTSGRRNSEMGW